MNLFYPTHFGILVACSLMFVGTLSQSAAAHPFHVSVGEMEYDAETKKLEIAVRVWPLDLHRSVKQKLKAEIDLDSKKESVVFDTDKSLQKYLKSAFQVESEAGKSIAIEWVGRELDGTNAWLYFQIDVESETKLNGLKFTNRLCFEALRDQTNTIKFKDGDQNRVLQFTREAPSAILETTNN